MLHSISRFLAEGFDRSTVSRSSHRPLTATAMAARVIRTTPSHTQTDSHTRSFLLGHRAVVTSLDLSHWFRTSVIRGSEGDERSLDALPPRVSKNRRDSGQRTAGHTATRGTRQDSSEGAPRPATAPPSWGSRLQSLTKRLHKVSWNLLSIYYAIIPY